MNLIWLESTSGAAPQFVRTRKEIIVVSSTADAAAAAARHDGPAVIVEVRDAADAQRAMAAIEAMGNDHPLWVFQPEATVESTLAFMTAGSTGVMTRPDEIEHALSPAPTGKALMGNSRSIQSVLANIALVASRRCNVLIEGETGTGKEVVAREIHGTGNRARGPWVAVNCGAIPEALLEAELFGHVRGAFTGAVQSRAGKFEVANHGTIFLDEIGDMPFAVQAKLLRVLQEKEVERLGGNERVRLDVRVIAATNANLQEKVERGLFRQDLFYRLNVFRIALTPLRERPVDIPVLAHHFIGRICAAENVRAKSLHVSALQALFEHTWPGNARELENVMETALILSGSRPTIFASDIQLTAPTLRMPPQTAQSSRALLPSGGLDYQQALETFEHDLLTQALARTRGNKTAAADLLRLKRTTLSARMRVLESRMPRLVA